MNQVVCDEWRCVALGNSVCRSKFPLLKHFAYCCEDVVLAEVGKQVMQYVDSVTGCTLPQDFYLIEEATIGLPPQDVRLLVNVLRRLVEMGNTVVVIEHNLELIAEADYVIDVGPGAGAEGGTIVAQGTVKQLARHKTAPTAPFIRQELNFDKKFWELLRVASCAIIRV